MSRIRRPIHRDFKLAIRASGHTLVTLAALSGFAAHTQLSETLSGKHVPVTPLTVARLTALASLIQYTGPIFREQVGRG